MNPIQKVAANAVQPKKLSVVLESSNLPKLEKVEDKLHDYFSRSMPYPNEIIKPASQETAKPVEHILNFFG